MGDDGAAVMGKTPVHVMWAEMEALVEAGVAKSIGVSNFPVLMLHDLLCYANSMGQRLIAWV